MWAAKTTSKSWSQGSREPQGDVDDGGSGKLVGDGMGFSKRFTGRRVGVEEELGGVHPVVLGDIRYGGVPDGMEL